MTASPSPRRQFADSFASAASFALLQTKDIQESSEPLRGFIEKFPTFTFTQRGEVQSYNGVGRLAWGYGPVGAEAVVTGIDVLVMKGDKIGAVYVFPDSPKK